MVAVRKAQNGYGQEDVVNVGGETDPGVVCARVDDSAEIRGDLLERPQVLDRVRAWNHHISSCDPVYEPPRFWVGLGAVMVGYLEGSVKA